MPNGRPRKRSTEPLARGLTQGTNWLMMAIMESARRKERERYYTHWLPMELELRRENEQKWTEWISEFQFKTWQKQEPVLRAARAADLDMQAAAHAKALAEGNAWGEVKLRNAGLLETSVFLENLHLYQDSEARMTTMLEQLDRADMRAKIDQTNAQEHGVMAGHRRLQDIDRLLQERGAQREAEVTERRQYKAPYAVEAGTREVVPIDRETGKRLGRQPGAREVLRAGPKREDFGYEPRVQPIREPLTQRGPVDETKFQRWYAGHAKATGISANPDDPQHQYDYRAAFAAGAQPDAAGHWPSEFKRAGHPNLIVDGRDTRIGDPAKLLPPDEVKRIAQTLLGGLRYRDPEMQTLDAGVFNESPDEVAAAVEAAGFDSSHGFLFAQAYSNTIVEGLRARGLPMAGAQKTAEAIRERETSAGGIPTTQPVKAITEPVPGISPVDRQLVGEIHRTYAPLREWLHANVPDDLYHDTARSLMLAEFRALGARDITSLRKASGEILQRGLVEIHTIVAERLGDSETAADVREGAKLVGVDVDSRVGRVEQIRQNLNAQFDKSMEPGGTLEQRIREILPDHMEGPIIEALRRPQLAPEYTEQAAGLLPERPVGPEAPATQPAPTTQPAGPAVEFRGEPLEETARGALALPERAVGESIVAPKYPDRPPYPERPAERVFAAVSPLLFGPGLIGAVAAASAEREAAGYELFESTRAATAQRVTESQKQALRQRLGAAELSAGTDSLLDGMAGDATTVSVDRPAFGALLALRSWPASPDPYDPKLAAWATAGYNTRRRTTEATKRERTEMIAHERELQQAPRKRLADAQRPVQPPPQQAGATTAGPSGSPQLATATRKRQPSRPGA